MSDLWNAVSKLDLEDAVELTTRALELIGKLTGNATLETAHDVVKLVRNVYDAITKVGDDAITVEDAHKALDQLEVAIAANDAAIDEAIRKKFDEDTTL